MGMTRRHPKGFARDCSRSCLRATAPRFWADAKRGDLRLAVHAMNVDCSDEVVVRAEVTRRGAAAAAQDVGRGPPAGRKLRADLYLSSSSDKMLVRSSSTGPISTAPSLPAAAPAALGRAAFRGGGRWPSAGGTSSDPVSGGAVCQSV